MILKVFIAVVEEEPLIWSWRFLRFQISCLDICVENLFFLTCLTSVFLKQDGGCLLKLNIPYQVYKNIRLLFC